MADRCNIGERECNSYGCKISRENVLEVSTICLALGMHLLCRQALDGKSLRLAVTVGQGEDRA